jgi:hypothetical protein
LIRSWRSNSVARDTSTGRLNKKPCAWRHPAATRNSAWASVYTLGDDVDTEFSCEPDHGLHRGGMTLVTRHTGDKFPRELEPIERQYGEIFER